MLFKNWLNVITRYFKLLTMGFKIGLNQFQSMHNGPNVIQNGLNLNVRLFKLPTMGFKIGLNQFQECNGP